MNEKELIAKAKDFLTQAGGMAWAVRTGHDIFGIFDIVYLSPAGRTSFYQVSTTDHKWSRSIKILNFKTKYGALPERSYLMLWNYQANQFDIGKA